MVIVALHVVSEQVVWTVPFKHAALHVGQLRLAGQHRGWQLLGVTHQYHPACIHSSAWEGGGSLSF